MAFTDKLWDGKGMDYSRAFAMTFIKVILYNNHHFI